MLFIMLNIYLVYVNFDGTKIVSGVLIFIFQLCFARYDASRGLAYV